MTEHHETDIFGYYNDSLKSVSEFFQKNRFHSAVSVPETLRLLSEGLASGVELYDVWLDGIHHLTDQSFAICRKVADGEKTDMKGWVQASEQMYENLTDQMSSAVRGTPFEKMEPLIKSSSDFRMNGGLINAFWQPIIDMGVSMAAMFKVPYNNASDMRSEQEA